MAHNQPRAPSSLLTKEGLRSKLEDVKSFDPNAILRGAQLTVVGAHRALQNPALFTSEHYRQAAYAIAAGIAIRLLIAIPIWGVKLLLWSLSFFIAKSATWDESIVSGLDFVMFQCLQIPFFLMSLMRYVTPTLDNMQVSVFNTFMDSLLWVDQTYYKKHEGEDANNLREGFYPNLRKYPTRDGSTHTTSTAEAVSMYLVRVGKRAGISLIVYALSYVPYVGRLVLPAASFYTFKQAVGIGPATVIFGTGIFLPRRYLVVILQSYFASRSLVRELLEPYFSRIRFSQEEKKRWFRDRQGLLFGFGFCFYIFQRIPLLGVLVYGIAEASTAYLITKITDPPPPPNQSEGFAASQQKWRNKHEIIQSSLSALDAHNLPSRNYSAAGQAQASTSAAPSEPPPPYTELRSR
ncbi:putative transmembrane protein UsgS [Coleophoma crateriformis]|uniref:Putative transmembrane protein UsgS n=1 Tax=Coleophoma crateriformis TaxID=565419 RepID=A0A3D8RIA3_9HELO|nr:putative transmembrane protein UsgS [Coleophoma crateriformis]